MAQMGTEASPLRVAVIGAGPAGFYAAEHLLKHKQAIVSVDMFDRLPTPFGLVRGGVAPDHQKIKAITARYTQTARLPRFRFFGNVELGKHLTLEDLRRHYHQIVYATGAQTDRRLGIPGEDLDGSHSATEFVAWYNGHPDYRDLTFDLSQERVGVIGVGNVAVDVARILCRTVDELAKTDIADYALDALRMSRVREVYMLGRRGPAQAAFTNPEVKELGELRDADVWVPPDEAQLDEHSRRHLNANPERETERKVEILQDFSKRISTGKTRRLILRFLVSPIEIVGDEFGHVKALRLMRNRLTPRADGHLNPEATGEVEDLPVGLVFRSVGYHGVALAGVPFHERWGVIHNEGGRVTDLETREPVVGEYTAGWIKRGPTGVIGTNKADAQETVEHMIEDAASGRILDPPTPDPSAIEALLAVRQPDTVTFEDWDLLDRLEMSRGKPLGRPRLKYTAVDAMLDALRNAPPLTPAVKPPSSSAQVQAGRPLGAKLAGTKPMPPGAKTAMPPGASPKIVKPKLPPSAPSTAKPKLPPGLSPSTSESSG